MPHRALPQHSYIKSNVQSDIVCKHNKWLPNGWPFGLVLGCTYYKDVDLSAVCAQHKEKRHRERWTVCVYAKGGGGGGGGFLAHLHFRMLMNLLNTEQKYFSIVKHLSEWTKRSNENELTIDLGSIYSGGCSQQNSKEWDQNEDENCRNCKIKSETGPWELISRTNIYKTFFKQPGRE